MQVGADIYCDTALIARLLEQRAPQPPLFPASAPLAPLVAQWADSTLFWSAIPYALQPAALPHVFAGVPAEVVKGFAADRAPFAASIRRQTLADATANLHRCLAQFSAQLADGRPGLLGDVSVADFAVAHCGWYLRRTGPLAGILAPYAPFSAWLDSMLAIGHGRREPMTSAEAVALAAAATRRARVAVEPGLGFEAGQRVTVTPTDYGMDPVAGTLVGLDRDEVVLARTDERAGPLQVHFPRQGFQIKQEKMA